MYNNGDEVPTDKPCEGCDCIDGEIGCWAMLCQPDPVCEEGEELAKSDDECCSTCKPGTFHAASDTPV